MTIGRPCKAHHNLIWSFLSVVGFFAVQAGAIHAQAQVRSEMRLFSDSFVSPAFEATQKNNYQFIGAKLENAPDSDDAFKLDLTAGVAVGAPLLNYFNISEFYMETRHNKDEAFFVGRKKISWSDLDARWDLGVWEPLFKWNPLAPERQGLTGLYWQLEKKYYQITLYGSPFFVPDQGPSFEIENGNFVRGNPWFRRPPESIKIFDEQTSIQYHFDRPSESEVVMHSSFGGKVAVGDPEELHFQVSYIYKPANQLAVGYDGYLKVDTGYVDLLPEVYYHSLVGADLQYSYSGWRVGISAIHDRPNREEIFEEKWTHQVFENATLVSPFIEWKGTSVVVQIQRLDISGGRVVEDGELASSVRAPLMNPYPYRQATKVSLGTNLRFGQGRRLATSFSYTQDDNANFTLLRMNGHLRFSGMWSLFTEAQLVDSKPYGPENQNEISQFVNNDRVMFGVSYVL